MADLPKITIITPSFNQGRFIEQTIQSVLNQGYPDLEYLVMDGGSTDTTLDVLRRYEEKLTFTSEPDRGQTHAINKGLERASGEVVSYLNSDDLLAPNALLHIGQFFNSHPEADWLSGYCRMINKEGKETRNLVSWYKKFWLTINSPWMLAMLNYVSQPATFWRRKVVQQIGEFSERWQYAMDYEYWLRMSQSHRLNVLRMTLAYFRVHPDSKSGLGTVNQFREELLITQEYIHSPTRITLHRLHNQLILWSYRNLISRND